MQEVVNGPWMSWTAQIRETATALNEALVATEVLENLLQKEIVAAIAAKESAGSELATRIGISRQYLCDICHGRRKISKQIVSKILRELGPV